MWDTTQETTPMLSHDLPCSRCGHAAHTYLSCSDSCDCVPVPMPGQVVPELTYAGAHR